MKTIDRYKACTIRNLIIFSVAALGGGFLGIFLDRLSPSQNRMEGLGVLVWLATPLVVNLLLRSLGGDGWKDFGFLPKLRSSWKWYMTAVLLTPLVAIITLSLGLITGAVCLPGADSNKFLTFISLTGAAFAGNMIKNIFEEFAWRGYLTPRFAALGLNRAINSILTGFIWAGWHIPYYLYFLDRAVLKSHTTLSLPVFLFLSFLILPFQALAYGELRLVSKTVWVPWLLHNFANAISLSLFSSGIILLNSGPAGIFFSPGTEGILYALLMGFFGFILYRYKGTLAAENS